MERRLPGVVGSVVVVLALLCACASMTNDAQQEPATQGRTNSDGSPCISMADVSPTPVGAGPEALAQQLPLCVEDFIGGAPPVISSTRYPTGETFPCIEVDATVDWAIMSSAEQLRNERDRADEIVAWADVPTLEISTAPSLDFGPYAVSLANAANADALPDEAYGGDSLLAAQQIAGDGPIRLGIGQWNQIVDIRVFVSETTGWLPIAWCMTRRFTPIDDLFQTMQLPNSLRAANDLLLTLNGHPDAAEFDDATFERWLTVLSQDDEVAYNVQLVVPEQWLTADEPWAVCIAGLDLTRCMAAVAFREQITRASVRTGATVLVNDPVVEVFLTTNVPDAVIFPGDRVQDSLISLGAIVAHPDRYESIMIETDALPAEVVAMHPSLGEVDAVTLRVEPSDP